MEVFDEFEELIETPDGYYARLILYINFLILFSLLYME
jgi:hypothetical protein